MKEQLSDNMLRYLWSRVDRIESYLANGDNADVSPDADPDANLNVQSKFRHGVEVVNALIEKAFSCREFLYMFNNLPVDERESIRNEMGLHLKELVLRDINRIKVFVLGYYTRQKQVLIPDLNNLLRVIGRIWYPCNHHRPLAYANDPSVESAFDGFYQETAAVNLPPPLLFDDMVDRCRLLTRESERFAEIMFSGANQLDQFFARKLEICHELCCPNDWLCAKLKRVGAPEVYCMVALVIRNPLGVRGAYFTPEQRTRVLDTYFNYYVNVDPTVYRYPEMKDAFLYILNLARIYFESISDESMNNCHGVDCKTFIACPNTSRREYRVNSRKNPLIKPVFCTNHFKYQRPLQVPWRTDYLDRSISISNFTLFQNYQYDVHDLQYGGERAEPYMTGWVDHVVSSYDNNKQTLLQVNSNPS